MNIPTELWDHMLRIPPGEIKLLDYDELQRYGLNKPDPYEDAAATAREAKGYGITVQELLRRKARVNAECKFPSFSISDAESQSRSWVYVVCTSRIMEGLKAECLFPITATTMSDGEIENYLRLERECSKVVVRP
ncbi:MAG: hypothetical protein DMG09_08590 [Acidobacteria bacterium]|nr:MAG: hypothetical protein DMG09_08590 [Acidobacteriota bacterium]